MDTIVANLFWRLIHRLEKKSMTWNWLKDDKCRSSGLISEAIHRLRNRYIYIYIKSRLDMRSSHASSWN
jgi:hypothetical protein